MEDYKQTLYNDELLNILPDGVIIFDTNGEVIQLNQQAFAELHVHPSVNDMLPFPTNRLFKLLNKKEDILSTILEKIRQGENTYSLPEHTFMQEQVDYTQFPIRGEFATISKGLHSAKDIIRKGPHRIGCCFLCCIRQVRERQPEPYIRRE